MSEQYCQVCKRTFDGYTTTIEIADDREKIQITGHDNCTNEIYNKVKKIKDLPKKSVKQILKEINYIRENENEVYIKI